MYQLLDSGNGQKLERFGELTLIRPCAQAIWSPKLPKKQWELADALFSRDDRWILQRALPEEWEVTVSTIRFKLKRTDFGHLGIFPEQAPFWMRILKSGATQALNLFAYSGGSSIAAALGGAKVTHVDSAKGMVQWAAENAELNGVQLRLIVEDARKYLARALRREERYDAIILDPPTFGRGKSGEVFKIENDLIKMLQQCRDLLSSKPRFLLLSCHTPGYTPLLLKQLIQEVIQSAQIEVGEMFLEGPSLVPSGAYAYVTF